MGTPRRTARYERYPAYKDSGIEWLGEIPEGWHVRKIKFSITQLVGGGTPESDNDFYWAEEGGTRWVAIGDMSNTDVVKDTEKSLTNAGLASKGLRVLPSRTLIYSMYASVGKVSILAIPAATNQAIVGLIHNEQILLNRVLFYALKAVEPYVQRDASLNTQNNINAAKVRNIVLPTPTRDEQQCVITFLDRKAAQIDAVIEKKQKLIELLKEKRQALITHAVTKGLDPKAKMKDSGVEWLGEIPERWEVVQIKTLFRRIKEMGHPTYTLLSVYRDYGVVE